MGVKIVGARVLPYRRRLTKPFITAAGCVEERRGFLLRLEDADGLIGYGEASPVWWAGGESLAATGAALVSFAKSVAGSPCDGVVISAELASTPSALAAIDCALLDLEGRRRGISVAQTIHSAAASFVETNALATAEDPEDLAAEANALAAGGFRTVKLKVGIGPLQRDLERVRAVRSGANRLLMLRLDANRAWDLDTARQFFARAADTDIDYVEEPLRAGSADDLATLRASGAIRIALDESISTLTDIERSAEAKACDVVVLKLARIGSSQRVRELADFASDCGLEATITDSLETEIGQAAAVHLAAAVCSRSAVGLAGRALLVGGESSPLASPRVTVPGPGLGIECEAITDAWSTP